MVERTECGGLSRPQRRLPSFLGVAQHRFDVAKKWEGKVPELVHPAVSRAMKGRLTGVDSLGDLAGGDALICP